MKRVLVLCTSECAWKEYVDTHFSDSSVLNKTNRTLTIDGVEHIGILQYRHMLGFRGCKIKWEGDWSSRKDFDTFSEYARLAK